MWGDPCTDFQCPSPTGYGIGECVPHNDGHRTCEVPCDPLATACQCADGAEETTDRMGGVRCAS
jgi:hypothetical protein